MTLALDTLPDDAESLKALIARLAADREDLAAQCGRLKHERAEWRQEKAALAAEVERLEANNARLDHIVMVLRRGRFGRSSERRICRAKRSSSSRRARSAHAAAPCMSSAKTSPSGSTGSPPSCASSLRAVPNMPVASAPTA